MDQNFLPLPSHSFGCSPMKINKMESAQHVTQMLNHFNSSRGLKPPVFGGSPQALTLPQMASEPHDGKWSLCNAPTPFGWRDTLMHMVFSFNAMMPHPLVGLEQNTSFAGSFCVPKMSGFANNPPPFIPCGMTTSQLDPSNNSTYDIPNQPFFSLSNNPQSQYKSSMMDIYLNCKSLPKNNSPLKKSYKLNPEAAEYIPKTKGFANTECQSGPRTASCVKTAPTSHPPNTGHSSDSLAHTQFSSSSSHQHLQAESVCLSPEQFNSHLIEEGQLDSIDNSPSSRVHSKMAFKDLEGTGVALSNGNSQEDLVLLPLSSTTVAYRDPMLSISQCGKGQLPCPVSCEVVVNECSKSKKEISLPTNFSHFPAICDDTKHKLFDNCCSTHSTLSTSRENIFSNSSYSDNDDSTSFDSETESDDSEFEDKQQRSRLSSTCTTNSESTSFDETESDDSLFDVFFEHDEPQSALLLAQVPRKSGQQPCSRPSNCTNNSHPREVSCDLSLTRGPADCPQGMTSRASKVESTTNHESTREKAPSQQPGWSILSYILQTTFSDDSSENENSFENDSSENEDSFENDSDYECEIFNLELDYSWQNPLGSSFTSQFSPDKNMDTTDCAIICVKDEVQSNRNACNVREYWPEKIPTRVRFSDQVETHFVEKWDRGGEWEQHARDRMRFRTRINEMESILAPILDPAHRWQVFCKQEQP